jgi:hypothetical protein
LQLLLLLVHVLLVEELALEARDQEKRRFDDDKKQRAEDQVLSLCVTSDHDHLLDLNKHANTSDDEVWLVTDGQNVNILYEQQESDQRLVVNLNG